MIEKSLEIFIEKEIIPQYEGFDPAHKVDHARHVIAKSIDMASKLGLDENMAYTIAAYHDLGLSGPRETHHLLSAQIMRKDDRLMQWFSADSIETMAQAVEDHRASSKNPPRSIYGKVVSEADRDLSPETVIRRTIQYGKSHYPELDRDGHYSRMKAHLQEKYAEGGYIKLWLPESGNAERIKRLREAIKDENKLRELFEIYF